MKFFNFLNNHINKIPVPVLNVINFLATILTILTAIGIPTGVFGFLSLYIENENNSKSISVKFIIVLMSFFILFCSIRYVWFKSKCSSIQKELSNKCYMLLHEYRNEINQMELYYKEIEKGIRTWDMVIFTRLVQEFLVKGLDCLCTSISIQSNDKVVCGCIKSIIPDSLEDITYNNAIVKTLARSTNTDSSRKSLDIDNSESPRVFLNTDFKSIILGEETNNHDVFYRQNLIEYDNELHKLGKQYDNTTPHWENRYKASIVAPIRIANSRLHYKSQDTKYDIIGFLCVDSMDTNIFTETQRENFTYLVKAYSAVFYNMMSKYQYYLIKFSEYEKNNTKISCDSNPSTNASHIKQRNSKKGTNKKRK